MTDAQDARADDDYHAEFDETNGVVQGLDGDSDGTASGDSERAARGSDDAPEPVWRAAEEAEFGLTEKPTDAAGHPQD